MLRSGVGTLAQSAVARRLLALVEAVGGGGGSRVTVLTYHRVGDPASTPRLFPGLVSAGADEFASQMEFLAGHCSPLALDDLIAALRSPGRLPPRAVLVTFDDAYRDVGEVAWPVARRLGIPIALFVPTDFPDSGHLFWWDRLYAALMETSMGEIVAPGGTRPLRSPHERLAVFRELRRHLKAAPHAELLRTVAGLERELGARPMASPVMGWDELLALRAEGVTLAPHGRTHAMLDRLPPAELRDEIDGSLAELERRVGPSPAAFAYPSGQHSPAVVAAVRAAGMEVAFTTARGANDLRHADPLRLRRVNVGRRSSLDLIRWQLAAAPLTAR